MESYQKIKTRKGRNRREQKKQGQVQRIENNYKYDIY